MVAEPQRYLLCRPRGGLNDTLCQIEKCRAYAARHHRTLIVDTRRSGLLSECADYFVPLADGAIFSTEDPRLAGLDFDAMTCRPALFEGRVAVLPVPRAGRGRGTAVGAHTGFDLSRDHPETLLIHERHGGGNDGLKLLNHVKFAEPVAAEIRAALSALGPLDAALHIRNTDYRTELRGLFSRIAPQLADRRVLICTDDSKTLMAARAALPRSEIVTASEIVFADGRQLHEPEFYSDDTLRRRATLNSLIDLCALASADTLYVAQLAYGNYSGFSKLAGYLATNKNVLDGLLGYPAPTPPRPPAQVIRVSSSSPLGLFLRTLGMFKRMPERLQRALHRARRGGGS